MRLRLTTWVASGMLALGLAACGSSGNSVPTTQDAPTLSQVASQVGATNVQPQDPTMYATHEGTATWHGQQVDIVTFSSTDLRDNWVKMATEFGPVIKEGPLWAMTGL